MNHYIFSRFLKEESEISIQKDFGHLSYTQIGKVRTSDSLLTNREKNKAWQKSLQIQAKSCELYFEQCISW